MNKKIMLAGEPMGLFIAQNEGSFEDVEVYKTAVAGAELNVAIGLRRLEHSVGYLTKLGTDPFGKQVIKVMDKNNIETSLVSFSSERSTGFMLKSKVSKGDPDIYYYRKNSAASSIGTEDIETIDFKNYGYLHMTGILPAISESAFEASKALMIKAKENNMTVFFDPNLRPQLWKDQYTMVQKLNELAKYATYILPGIKEGNILTGGYSSVEEISEFYHKMGVKTVIIKTGSDGAYLSTENEKCFVKGFKADVVDTVGAGDGFAAGIISAIAEGLSAKEAVRRGNAIGAIQVMSLGDNEGLPNREQLEMFINK